LTINKNNSELFLYYFKAALLKAFILIDLIIHPELTV